MLFRSEGAWTPDTKIENLAEGEKPASPDDLSASFSLSRDKDDLLVKVKVNDDKKGYFPAGARWAEDCIELFLDLFPTRGDEGNPDKYGKTTYQFAISPYQKPVIFGQGQAHIEGMTADITLGERGYEAVIRVPLAALSPLTGKSIGFDLAIDDSDGGERKTQLVWSGVGAIPNYRDRSGFGVICF